MGGLFQAKYFILSVFLVATAASSSNDAGSSSVLASGGKLKSGQAKTICNSGNDCRADDDAYCSLAGFCECYGNDYYSPTNGCEDWDDLDDGVKVAAGIIITLAILIPIIIIASIVACCCCCAGCAGHAWRQRRNQPPQQQVFVGAYDQHGNPAQYGGPPPIYVQSPNNGSAPYPAQSHQPQYQNRQNNQKQDSY